MLGLVLLLLVHRRSKQVYAALALTVIVSMVGSPLLQVHQAYAYHEPQAASETSPSPYGRVTPLKTLAEVDAALNRALQTYLNLPADLDPAARQQMEDVLSSVIEGYAAQRQALLASESAPYLLAADGVSPQDVSSAPKETPPDDVFPQVLGDYINSPEEYENTFKTFDLSEAIATEQQDEGTPSDAPYVWGMEAQNEETGQRATWLMTAHPQGDRQAFGQAFNDLILNRRGEADANSGLTVSEKESLTDESALYSLKNAFDNPTDGEKLPDSLRMLLSSRPSDKVQVIIRAVRILQNCEDNPTGGDWHLHVDISGNLLVDGVEETVWKGDWRFTADEDKNNTLTQDETVIAKLNDDTATIGFQTSGWEDDSWPDDDEDLPRASWTHSSSDNWGTDPSPDTCGGPSDMPGERCKHLGPASHTACEYILYYDITPVPPIFADLQVVSMTDAMGGSDANDVNYTVTVKNNGPGDATGATLTVNFDTGLTYRSSSTGCSPSGNTVNCTFDLTKSTEKQFTVGTDAKSDTAGPVTSSATVSVNSSNNDDPDSGNNSKSKTTNTTDLDLVSMNGPSEAGAGTQLDYIIKVKNNGPFRPGAKLTVNLGDDLTYNSGQSSIPDGATCTPAGSTVNCTFNISAGQELEFTIATNVPLTASGEVTSSATASLTQAGLSDPLR